MGIRTKKIFRIGVLVITFICFINPFSYLAFGKITTGKVVEIQKRSTSGKYGGKYYTPIVEFETERSIVTFAGVVNSNYKYGDSVRVIYYPSTPTKAKVFSILGLCSNSFIGLVFFLSIWYAFTSSFKNIFDKPLAGKIE